MDHEMQFQDILCQYFPGVKDGADMMLNVKELLSAIQKTEGWKNTSVKHEYVFYSDLLAELMFVCQEE